MYRLQCQRDVEVWIKRSRTTWQWTQKSFQGQSSSQRRCHSGNEANGETLRQTKWLEDNGGSSGEPGPCHNFALASLLPCRWDGDKKTDEQSCISVQETELFPATNIPLCSTQVVWPNFVPMVQGMRETCKNFNSYYNLARVATFTSIIRRWTRVTFLSIYVRATCTLFAF